MKGLEGLVLVFHPIGDLYKSGVQNESQVGESYAIVSMANLSFKVHIESLNSDGFGCSIFSQFHFLDSLILYLLSWFLSPATRHQMIYLC